MSSQQAEIVNVFISNSNTIHESISKIIKETFYQDRESIIRFAERKLPAISSIRRKYSAEGDLLWRLEAEKILEEYHLTPKEIHEFFTTTKFEELPTVKEKKIRELV